MTGIEGAYSIRVVHGSVWYCVTVMIVGFEALTAVAMIVTVFWGIAPKYLLHGGLLLD
jgi:hypothetical protein